MEEDDDEEELRKEEEQEEEVVGMMGFSSEVTKWTPGWESKIKYVHNYIMLSVKIIC